MHSAGVVKRHAHRLLHRRRTVAFAALAALLLVIAVATAALFAMSAGLLEPAPGLERLFDGPSGTLSRLALGAGALAVGLTSLALLVRRTGPEPRSARTRFVLVSDERGAVFLAGAGLETLVHAAVVRQTGVVEAEVRARARGPSAVALGVRAAVLPGASPKEVGDAVRAGARAAVERMAALEVTEVAVEVIVMPIADAERLLE